MWLVMEVRSSAVKSSIAQEPRMLEFMNQDKL